MRGSLSEEHLTPEHEYQMMISVPVKHVAPGAIHDSQSTEGNSAAHLAHSRGGRNRSSPSTTSGDRTNLSPRRGGTYASIDSICGNRLPLSAVARNVGSPLATPWPLPVAHKPVHPALLGAAYQEVT